MFGLVQQPSWPSWCLVMQCDRDGMKLKLESKQRYAAKQRQAIRVQDESGIERGKKPVNEETGKHGGKRRAKNKQAASESEQTTLIGLLASSTNSPFASKSCFAASKTIRCRSDLCAAGYQK